MLTPLWKDTSRTPWTPWRELRAMQRDLDRIFDNYPSSDGSNAEPVLPTYEVEEKADAFAVTVDVPGVKPEDVQVSLKDGRLDVTAAATHAKRQRKFRVAFTLPTDIDETKLEATLDHGVLTLNLPKTAKPEARHIPVKAGSPAPSKQASPTAA